MKAGNDIKNGGEIILLLPGTGDAEITTGKDTSITNALIAGNNIQNSGDIILRGTGNAEITAGNVLQFTYSGFLSKENAGDLTINAPTIDINRGQNPYPSTAIQGNASGNLIFYPSQKHDNSTAGSLSLINAIVQNDGDIRLPESYYLNLTHAGFLSNSQIDVNVLNGTAIAPPYVISGRGAYAAGVLQGAGFLDAPKVLINGEPPDPLQNANLIGRTASFQSMLVSGALLQPAEDPCYRILKSTLKTKGRAVPYIPEFHHQTFYSVLSTAQYQAEGFNNASYSDNSADNAPKPADEDCR